MSHKIHDLVQGSDEWAEHRAGCNNASDLAAARNESPHKSRTELIREIATGVTAEIDEFTQKRFDNGHRFEDLARPLAEEIIGDDLYPITVSVDHDALKRPLSASLDGSTADDETNFEHKVLNQKLSESLDAGVIPDEYHPQMEQGMMINGAKRTLFMATKWDENDNLIEEKHLWYQPDDGLRASIALTWAQLEDDADNYQHVEPAAEVVGKAPETLPALRIEVTGMVTESNMIEFREQSLAVINNINTDLQTDQDFESAKKTVKWLGGVEEKLEAAKNHALSQTSSIDDLFRTIDDIKEEARTTRLNLNRAVTVREKARKEEIIMIGKNAFAAHVRALNDGFGRPYMPELIVDFIGVCKGLKTMTSRQNAVDSELAKAKISANIIAEKIHINRNTLKEFAEDYKFLFPDLMQVILKENDDFVSMVKTRIAEHKEAEEKRLQEDRDRIRKEEEDKVNAEQARIAAEKDRLQEAEEEAKHLRDEETASIERTATERHNPAVDRTQAYSGGNIDSSVNMVDPENDIEATENNIRVSLINNGVGPQSAKKIAKLLVSGKVKNVTCLFEQK